MHLVGVRRALAERHPWLPAAVLKAFAQAKAVALARLGDTAATKVTLPFVEEQLAAARDLMGEDYWSYGLSANAATLEAFLRHHHAQGLSPRLLSPPELFHPADARDGARVKGSDPAGLTPWHALPLRVSVPRVDVSSEKSRQAVL